MLAKGVLGSHWLLLFIAANMMVADALFNRRQTIGSDHADRESVTWTTQYIYIYIYICPCLNKLMNNLMHTHTHAHTHLVSLYSSALDKILADALVSNKHQTTIIGEPVLLAFYV